MPNKFHFNAIGVLHCGFKEKFGVPRQSGLASAARVADELKRLRLVLQGVDRDLSVGGDRPLQIPMLVIHRGRRRVTKKDCRFMVTKSEMRGIQGWFLKRLGCFSINQLSPSLSALRYAIDLIEKGEQLVVFPEGKINRYGKKLVLKEGLYRLAKLATKKTTSINIIPIGIAYSKIPPNFRGEFCLSFGKPIPINDYSNFTIKDFNKFLNEKMTQEEEKALKNVGR